MTQDHSGDSTLVRAAHPAVGTASSRSARSRAEAGVAQLLSASPAESQLARMVVDYFGDDPIASNLTGDIALRDRARAILTGPDAADDAAFLALAPTLLPMLDEFDRVWTIATERYKRAVAALGGEPDDTATGTEAADDWWRRFHSSLGFRDYGKAREPAEELAERIEQMVESHMDVPARTLQGLLLKQRIGRSLEHFESYASSDLDRMAREPTAAGGGGEWALGTPPADPILPAIRTAQIALDAANAIFVEHGKRHPGADLPKAWNTAIDVATDLFRETVFTMTPTSFEGCRALAQATIDLREISGFDLEEDLPVVLQRIAGRAPAEAEAAPSQRPSILDAITKHERAFAAYRRANILCNDLDRGKGQRPTSTSRIDAAEQAATVASNVADQAWRDLFAARPQSLHDLWMLLTHIEEHHETYHGIADEPDIWGTLTGAVAAMRTAARAPSDPHDLSRLSVAQLARLYETCRQQRDILLTIEGQAMCEQPGDGGLNPLGEIVEAEGARFGLLSDDVVAEMERRQPDGAWERDQRLGVRVSHEMMCNGSIGTDMVAEIVKAWGAK